MRAPRKGGAVGSALDQTFGQGPHGLFRLVRCPARRHLRTPRIQACCPKDGGFSALRNMVNGW